MNATTIPQRHSFAAGDELGALVRNVSIALGALAGLMDDYTSQLRSKSIAGIPADHWILFFKRHAESKDQRQIHNQLTQDLSQSGIGGSAAADVVDAIFRIVERLT